MRSVMESEMGLALGMVEWRLEWWNGSWNGDSRESRIHLIEYNKEEDTKKVDGKNPSHD